MHHPKPAKRRLTNRIRSFPINVIPLLADHSRIYTLRYLSKKAVEHGVIHHETAKIGPIINITFRVIHKYGVFHVLPVVAYLLCIFDTWRGSTPHSSFHSQEDR
jgi:hypothetical protein